MFSLWKSGSSSCFWLFFFRFLFSRLFRLFPTPTNCPWISEDERAITGLLLFVRKSTSLANAQKLLNTAIAPVICNPLSTSLPESTMHALGCWGRSELDPELTAKDGLVRPQWIGPADVRHHLSGCEKLCDIMSYFRPVHIVSPFPLPLPLLGPQRDSPIQFSGTVWVTASRWWWDIPRCRVCSQWRLSGGSCQAG